MSRFKVGDLVRHIVTGSELTVNRVSDDSDAFTAKESCVWHAEVDFDLVSRPPQPVESPDDWVTQDVVPVRPDVDEWRWVDVKDGTSIADERGDWKSRRQIIRTMWHGFVDGTRFRLEVRCRRRDYPHRPVEVHTGGPYVARSEYERVCATIRELETGYAASIRRAEDIANQLMVMTGERDGLQKQVENLGRDVDILKGFNRELKQHGTSFELLEKLKAAEDKLAVQTRDMLWRTENQDKVISSQQEKILTLQSDCDSLRHSHKVLRADLQNSEECLAALSRNKVCPPLAVGSDGLVVEPIPTPAQDARVSCNEEGWVFLYKGALPAGWWYGFDSEGRWWGCSVRPRPTKYGWWEVPPGQTGDWQKLEGMPEADKSAWRENCWQVV